MTIQELLVVVDNSNMETEAKAEICDILQNRLWEDEQAEKGEKF